MIHDWSLPESSSPGCYAEIYDAMAYALIYIYNISTLVNSPRDSIVCVRIYRAQLPQDLRAMAIPINRAPDSNAITIRCR